jgi:hypothetical protein
MRKKYFLVAGAVLLCLLLIGAGWGWHLYNKPHAGVDGVTAIAQMTADSLFNRFQTDEAGSNKAFLGQVLEVKGKIGDVQKTDSTLNVELEGSSGLGGINCSMAMGQKNVLQKGQAITLKGRCTGFLMDVNLVDCVTE